MSTNFYLHTKGEEIHIGKRSAAGLYCYKCHTTTCEGGDKAIHTGRSPFSKTCPKCHMPVTTTTCSFTWALEPHRLPRIQRHDFNTKIYDEYGVPVSWIEFDFELAARCPIQFYDSIGVDFS